MDIVRPDLIIVNAMTIIIAKKALKALIQREARSLPSTWALAVVGRVFITLILLPSLVIVLIVEEFKETNVVYKNPISIQEKISFNIFSSQLFSLFS